MGATRYWVNNYFSNPQVVQVPEPYTLGNAGRTTSSIRTPTSFTSDLSIAKQFLLSNVHEECAWSCASKPTTLSSSGVRYARHLRRHPNFGVTNYLAVQPRQVQLAIKIVF